MSKLLFLGTGSSLGVPVIGCKCETCSSASPFNKRLRSSALLKLPTQNLLIDASPDMRLQALKFQINKIDAVLFTHAHYDHTAGVDDLRIYYFLNKKPLVCFASESTAEDLKVRYYYMFKEQPKEVINATRLHLQVFQGMRGAIDVLGQPISYFTYVQLGMNVNGFKIGNLAYVTDIKDYSDDIFKHLEGVDTLVLSALRFTPSHMHLSVDEAVDFANRSKAKMTWLTHLSHELEYEKTNSYLPSHIRLAYDGLEIDFNESI